MMDKSEVGEIIEKTLANLERAVEINSEELMNINRRLFLDAIREYGSMLDKNDIESYSSKFNQILKGDYLKK